MGARDEYVEELKEKLEQSNTRIRELEAKTSEANPYKMAESYRIKAIKEMYMEMQEKIEELEMTAEDGWENLKEGVESAWENLKEGFTKAKS